MRKTVVSIILLVATGLLLPRSGGAGGTVMLKEKRIRDAVTGFIMEKTAGSGLEIRIVRMDCGGDVPVPAGKVEFDVVAPRQWEGWGKTLLGLIVRVDNRVVRNMSVPVEVEALTGMVVALRPLERGEVIAEGDLAVQKRDLAAAPSRVCLDMAEAVGKRVRIGIRGNTPVRCDFLEKVPLVKYGQLVTIVAENGAMRVSASGKSKGSGAEGDLVTVQNMSSKKDVRARVLDSGTVMVDF